MRIDETKYYAWHEKNAQNGEDEMKMHIGHTTQRSPGTRGSMKVVKKQQTKISSLAIGQMVEGREDKMHWSHNATITGYNRLHEGSQKTTNKDQFIGNWANGGRKRR